MKCPECGVEMEKGYLISNAVRWSEKKHTQVAFGQELVVPWHVTALANTEAFRCPKCRLVMFHYPTPRAEMTPESFVKKCIKCGESIPVASDFCRKCGTKQKQNR